MCQEAMAGAGSSLAAPGESSMSTRAREGVAGPDAELEMGKSCWNGSTAPPGWHRPSNKRCLGFLFYFFFN